MNQAMRIHRLRSQRFQAKAGTRGLVTASYYWTVILKNDSTLRQEGVARLQLPEGAVVSRATDWVNRIP